jgi:CubicO group peptidase (beta-lactamase class C family)
MLKIKKHIMIAPILAFTLIGCGEDYKWDTDNTSPLEGKYETRATDELTNDIADLSREEQNKVAHSLVQKHFFSDNSITGMSMSIIYDDNGDGIADDSSDIVFGCAELDIDKLTGIHYDKSDISNCKEPLKSTHRFKLGSLTKTAVARTILDLVDEGKISLKDPISKYLDSSLGNMSGITIEHVLYHTSGLTNNLTTAAVEEAVATAKSEAEDAGQSEDEVNSAGSFARIVAQSNASAEEFIKAALSATRFSTPGRYYQYNNNGYIILGQIIEKVSSSNSWEVELSTRLNDTLGLTSFLVPDAPSNETEKTTTWTYGDTSWLTNIDENILTTTNDSFLATGYLISDDNFLSAKHIQTANYANSAGSMMGSVSDVSKWMRELATNESGLIQNSTLFEETVEGVYIDDYLSHNTWNMGPGLGYEQEQNAYFHLGAIHGYNCVSIYSKNESVTISACTTGGSSLSDFAYEVLNEMYPYRKPYVSSDESTIH